MKKKRKTSLCLLLVLCMAAMFLPQSLAAEDQAGSPTDDQPQAASPAALRNAPAPASYSTDEYTKADVDVINAIINNNGLQATIDAPADWETNGLVTWNAETPKRIIELNLRVKNLEGKLDVRGLTALTDLNCSQNNLTGLNFSGLTALTSLNCGNNQLTGTLNVSGLTGLTRLECVTNQLTGLTLGSLTSLTNLDCSGNDLQTLNLSGLTALSNLNCSGNQLTALDLNGLTELTFVDCAENKMTSLDFTGLSKLSSSRCSVTQLTDPSGKILKIDNAAGQGIAQISFYFSDASMGAQLNVYPKLGYKFDQWNDGNTDKLRNYPLTAASTTLTPMFVAEATTLYNEEDLALLQKLIQDFKLDEKSGILPDYPHTWSGVGWQADSVARENKRLIELWLGSRGLTGNLDVTGFTELEKLYCYDNQLTGLNVNHTNLDVLRCENNPLSSLKLSGNSTYTVQINVVGDAEGGQPWLESFDYDTGEGSYIAKINPGYTGTWSERVGCTETADGFTFDLALNDTVSATLTFDRDQPVSPDVEDEKIDVPGLEEGGQVEKGGTFTFTANPIVPNVGQFIAGDVRYMPVSWKVNPSGTFAGGNYTQSFSTKDMTLGEHTLTVTYRMEEYDGTDWVYAGETIEKSFNFTLVEKITPPDGNTPGGDTPGGEQNGNQSGTGAGGSSANPATGDSSYAWYIIGLALAGGSLLLLARKKKMA